MHRNMIRHQRLVAMLIRVSLSPLCWGYVSFHYHIPHNLLSYSSYSLSRYHPLPFFSSLLRSLWRKDEGLTDGQMMMCGSPCCLGSFFENQLPTAGGCSVWHTHFYYLMRMTFPWIAESTSLLGAYKYWWSQMSQWSHFTWWLDSYGRK